MFGSVFRIRPKSGKFPEIRKLMEGQEQEGRLKSSGWQGTHVLQEKNGDVWIMAVFKDEPSYRANASSPEQDKAYRQMRDLLEADPEWHDGTIEMSP
jgi:quinol monooxygenase YgiN